MDALLKILRLSGMLLTLSSCNTNLKADRLFTPVPPCGILKIPSTFFAKTWSAAKAYAAY